MHVTLSQSLMGSNPCHIPPCPLLTLYTVLTSVFSPAGITTQPLLAFT